MSELTKQLAEAWDYYQEHEDEYGAMASYEAAIDNIELVEEVAKAANELFNEKFSFLGHEPGQSYRLKDLREKVKRMRRHGILEQSH